MLLRTVGNFMRLHFTLEAVTARIHKRSHVTRRAYLACLVLAPIKF